MITNRLIDQAFSDLKLNCGGIREDYFGLLYLEQEYKLPREKAINQIAFGGNDYGVDGFHFDDQRRNLYLFQFKYSTNYAQFKGSLQRLIENGMERIFASPNKDREKNQVLLQLRHCINENRAIIDQICIRFVFTGDPVDAENSIVLDKLREDLENKKYFIDDYFSPRKVGFVVEFKSSSGKVGEGSGQVISPSFSLPLNDLVVLDGPAGEKMHIGFIRLSDLHSMHVKMGARFFNRNIRYGLGESEAVNRALSKAIRNIVLDRTELPSVFAFNHNGITLYAEKVEQENGLFSLTTPSLLNGAQTVTTINKFIESNKDNPKLAEGKEIFEDIRLLCKIITDADQKFVTRVTINNNRQNPVEPWNLHANDMIQLELQEKFRSEVGIYYERQENAFDQLNIEDLEEYGIKEESQAIQMLKLTQTFLVTDGFISRVNQIRRVFEEDRIYEQVFRQSRLKCDSRHILLCYKVERRLRKLTHEIEQKGVNKYSFISRCRYLLWALICQGLLNDPDLNEISSRYGTDLSIPADFTERLSYLATARVRLLLADLMQDRDYIEKAQLENWSFLRTDHAFEKSMEIAYKKWRWVHKKLA